MPMHPAASDRVVELATPRNPARKKLGDAAGGIDWETGKRRPPPTGREAVVLQREREAELERTAAARVAGFTPVIEYMDWGSARIQVCRRIGDAQPIPPLCLALRVMRVLNLWMPPHPP